MLHLFGGKAFENMIINPSTSDLREMSRHLSMETEFNSPCYVTKIRNRSAKNTFIVEEIKLGVDQKGIERKEADKIAREVMEYLKDKEVIRVDRKMGSGQKFSFQGRLYITKPYSRIAHMWNNSLFAPEENKSPDMVSVYVPEWPEKVIFYYPEESVTFILGTDYFGEAKKSFLRMAMYKVKKKGGLGLHAGSKVIRVKTNEGRLKDVGFIMFGLSGTGKTTLTIHDHNLQGEEKAIVRQDDVVFMDEYGACFGTENGFFIKTEGLDESQRVLYKAAVSENSIFENVMVKEDKTVDFNDTTLTGNGRGIVLRDEIENTDESIDLPKAHKIIFITRRNDIVPPIVKLNSEQALEAFMLGESIETSAGDPTKAGQSKRCVGTNPFITGLEIEEGERLKEILEKNPDMECYIMNTGSVGMKDGFKGEKVTISASTNIMREIARGSIEWMEDKDFGYMIPKRIEGVDLEKYNPRAHYSELEYNTIKEKLLNERKEWIAKYRQLVMA